MTPPVGRLKADGTGLFDLLKGSGSEHGLRTGGACACGCAISAAGSTMSRSWSSGSGIVRALVGLGSSKSSGTVGIAEAMGSSGEDSLQRLDSLVLAWSFNASALDVSATVLPRSSRIRFTPRGEIEPPSTAGRGGSPTTVRCSMGGEHIESLARRSRLDEGRPMLDAVPSVPRPGAGDGSTPHALPP